MRNSCFLVEGIEVNCTSLTATVGRITSDVGGAQSFNVFTLNLDHVVKLRRSKDFRDAYRNARYVTADGFPIVLAGRLLGVESDRVTGADLIEPLCMEAASNAFPVYLFGSTSFALEGAARVLSERCPGLRFAGMASPPTGFDPTSLLAVEFAQEIARSGAKICFVALGAPKQEMFAAAALDHAPGVAFICIGAGLDFLAGVQSRAPSWVRAAGGEWLWRLLSDPRRLGRRYLDCITVLPFVLVSSFAAQRSEGNLPS